MHAKSHCMQEGIAAIAGLADHMTMTGSAEQIALGIASEISQVAPATCHDKKYTYTDQSVGRYCQ